MAPCLLSLKSCLSDWGKHPIAPIVLFGLFYHVYSKDSLITKRQPPPAEDSGQTAACDENEMKKKNPNQSAYVPGHDSRIERAETRSEQAIRASELSYRRLFEAAKDGILILEADTGRISDVNPFLIEMLGFSHGELVGTPIWELGPFKDIVSNKAKFDQLHQQGYVRYEDLPLETRDGRHIAVEFVSNVYQAGDCKVIQCNVRDITERKRTERPAKSFIQGNRRLEIRAGRARHRGHHRPAGKNHLRQRQVLRHLQVFARRVAGSGSPHHQFGPSPKRIHARPLDDHHARPGLAWRNQEQGQGRLVLLGGCDHRAVPQRPGQTPSIRGHPHRHHRAQSGRGENSPN